MTFATLPGGPQPSPSSENNLTQPPAKRGRKREAAAVLASRKKSLTGDQLKPDRKKQRHFFRLKNIVRTGKCSSRPRGPPPVPPPGPPVLRGRLCFVLSFVMLLSCSGKNPPQIGPRPGHDRQPREVPRRGAARRAAHPHRASRHASAEGCPTLIAPLLPSPARVLHSLVWDLRRLQIRCSFVRFARMFFLFRFR